MNSSAQQMPANTPLLVNAPAMPLPWFSSKGQIVQTALAAIACVLAAIKVWQDIQNNEYFSPGAVLVYVLVALVLTVTIIANRRVSNVRTAKDAEIERLKSQSATRVEMLSRKLESYSRAEAVFDQIWQLKKEAREIKRRWPECLFVTAPLDRIRWSPFIGQPETGMGGIELEKAIQWHDAFSAYAKTKTDRQYSVHGDFDTVMAMLDRDERLELGLKL
jgi:hypothetical protein